MQGKGQSQRVKDRARSTVRAIPRARVQGQDQGLGHSNSLGSGVRSQRSGPFPQDHSQCHSAGYVQVRIRVTCRSGSGSGDRL